MANMLLDTEQAQRQNERLGQLEYEQRHLYLHSRPRCLGIVLGNACNIDCLHCYQAKNGDNLLHPAKIGAELRRELMAFYPYLSTLRIQGGEAFAMRGFRELIEDVSATVRRPILSVATNGTLIDEAWAERLVRLPFGNLTISIDGGTRATYNRLRRGADLDCVLANIDRVRRWKAKLASERPYLDSFFVVMRSNFREIPQYLELMREYGMVDVALQTMELSAPNTARHPTLAADEAIADPGEVAELHAMLREVLPHYQRHFRTVRVSGLQTLFEAHGLGVDFLEEGRNGLYPDSDDLAPGPFELCPNPWTTLFLAENGNVHLCFISEPIGNLYTDPLSAIWNSPQAIAKRSRMIAGHYRASGCSERHCGWREGKPSPGLDAGVEQPEARREWLDLVQLQAPSEAPPSSAGELALVRRLVAEEGRKRLEIEAYTHTLEAQARNAQRHIDHLEQKTEKALRDFFGLEAEFDKYCAPWPVRAVHKVAKLLGGA